jgi:hypothetical protein
MQYITPANEYPERREHVITYFMGRNPALTELILGKLFTPQYPKDMIVENRTGL